jgi:hypothetical protein
LGRHRDRCWSDLAGPTAGALGTGADSFSGSLPDPGYPSSVIPDVRAGGLTSDFISGDDDGLVPVDSTKVNGTTDFIVVESARSFMRDSDEVPRQAIALLQGGEFLYDQ